MKASITQCLSHTHTHTRLTALFPGLPGWAGTRKVKPIWILLKQETVNGSCISWAICKSASRSRQITMPVLHHSVFYRPDALPAAQPTASKHWRQDKCIVAERALSIKMGGWWRWGSDGVASKRIVGASISNIFPCTIKSRSRRAITEEVDKGCSEFCKTVDTITRTAGILIYSQLKPLAVNLSRSSGRLWL